MCWVIYVASDTPLPSSARGETDRRFCVEDLSSRDEPVRRHFSKPSVYRLGSREGRGCGLQYGLHEAFEDDPGALADADASRRDLAEFLTRALRHQSELEMFACWDGDQSAEPEFRATICPEDL